MKAHLAGLARVFWPMVNEISLVGFFPRFRVFLVKHCVYVYVICCWVLYVYYSLSTLFIISAMKS